MNTFLPYKSFKKSAQTLDYKRLGSQRSEAWIIFQTLNNTTTKQGWKHHPAVKMWKGYEKALLLYGVEMCKEWILRGYQDNMLIRFESALNDLTETPTHYPPLLFKPGFTDSHKSNLLRKNKNFYSKFGWKLPDNLPYMWS